MMGLSWGRAERRGYNGFFRFGCGNSTLQTDGFITTLRRYHISQKYYIQNMVKNCNLESYTIQQVDS